MFGQQVFVVLISVDTLFVNAQNKDVMYVEGHVFAVKAC